MLEIKYTLALEHLGPRYKPNLVVNTAELRTPELYTDP